MARIIDRSEASGVSDNDYVLLCSPTLGERKIKANKLGGGGGGTYTETKAVVFNNSTTTVNVGEDFLYGYGVAPSDNSYALVMSVSNGIAMAARTHNGVIDGISSNCSYSNGIFTFDAFFVANYFDTSTISVLCLYDGGSGEAKAFTGYNQIFKDRSMDVRFDPNGKFKVIWDGVTTVAIGCTMQGHTNLIGTYNNINIKGNITDSCEYHQKYGYERTQFVVGVTESDWQTAILVGYNDNGDVYKKEVITLTDQQVVNDINIDIDLNELAQQGYQSAYLFISFLGISGEFEVTIT